MLFRTLAPGLSRDLAPSRHLHLLLQLPVALVVCDTDRAQLIEAEAMPSHLHTLVLLAVSVMSLGLSPSSARVRGISGATGLYGTEKPMNERDQP